MIIKKKIGGQDSHMIDCIHKNCYCEEKIYNQGQIKQGNYGTCWFVAVLNILFISDDVSTILRETMSENKIKKHETICETPDNIVNHLMNDIVNKYYTKKKKISNIINYIFQDIFEEYITDKYANVKFGPENVSGGYPYKILVPYILYLKYPICKIKHIIMDFNFIINKFKIEPRTLKINRLCQDYIYNYKIVNIFIITFIQNMNDDNSYLYTGKYIIYINNKNLVVYKLDCGILINNNYPIDPNTGKMRETGHAICMLTCNKKGFIVNSHDLANIENIDNNIKTCTIFEHDWYKWKRNEYYYHTVIEGGCGNGEIKTKMDIQTLNSQNDFIYHKNQGQNTLIYTKYKIFEKFEKNQFELIHTNDSIKEYYNRYLKPYLYFILLELNELNKISNSEVIDVINNNLECPMVDVDYMDVDVDVDMTNVEAMEIDDDNTNNNNNTNTNDNNFFTIKFLEIKLVDMDIKNIDIFKTTFNYIQEGIVRRNFIKESWDSKSNMYVYEIILLNNDTINFISILKDCMSDDICILQNKENNNIFYLLIEYLKIPLSNTPKEHYGGNKI